MAMATGGWHHVVGVSLNGGVELFVDGVSVDTDSTALGAYANAASFRIATDGSTPTNFFNGRIDDVRINENTDRISDIDAFALALYNKGRS